MWEELPLPRNAWLSDVDFDENNPDIVYLIYSSDQQVNYLSSTGFKMVYKVDYTNPSLIQPGVCSTGCTDLTLNLPNVGVGSDAFVLEKGTDGGMYIGTDVGVFYTNNKMLASGTNWQILGTELPHVVINGLEINYNINKIRANTFGRGVWEHDLFCPPDYDINIHSNNYTTYNSKFNEAENNINIYTTGSSFTLNDFTARAGNEIVISASGNDEVVLSGFGNGSHLFIHACNHPGNSFRNTNPSPSPKNTNEYNTITSIQNNSTKKEVLSRIQLFPNPAQDHIHIQFKNNSDKNPVSIKIYSIPGTVYKVIERPVIKENEIILNVENIPDGLYFVEIQTNTGKQVEKLIIQK
jgi:hypothetical protein